VSNGAGVKEPVMTGNIGQGQLNIQINYREQCIVDVDIVSQRSLSTYRLLQGKTPEQALQLLPLLYSLCSTGQTVAGLRAIEHEAGCTAEVAVVQAREILLQAESCREILLRLSQSWLPRCDANSHLIQHFMIWYEGLRKLLAAALCLNPSASELIAAIRAIPLQVNHLEQLLIEFLGFKPTEITQELGKLQPDSVTTNSVLNIVIGLQQRFGHYAFADDLAAVPDFSGSNDVDQLERILTASDSRGFCVAPSWQQQCCETGSFQRMRNAPMIKRMRQSGWGEVVVRYCCMLLELAQMPERLRIAAKECFVHSGTMGLKLNNTGYGIAETARGTLLHRIGMEQDRVAEFHIVAPTEWNFHRHGILARKLKGLAVESERQALELTELFALLVDPCVGYQVSLKSELLHA